MVTKQLILNCPEVINLLNDNFGIEDKYHYEIIKNTASNILTFKMLTSNVSEVVGQLDEIRRAPRLVSCI